MHIAPRGSPQPTKQAFICKLYSGFPRIFSQQKPHRRICIPQGARNEVLQETQPRNLSSFFGDVFSQDKASKPPLYMHTARRKKRSFTGNSARTSNHFSVMLFSQNKASKPPPYMHTARRKKRSFTGNSARTSAHFSAMFFSQDKENERRRTSVLQAKFDTVLRKNSPKNQISIMSASFFFAISSISLTYLSVIF